MCSSAISYSLGFFRSSCLRNPSNPGCAYPPTSKSFEVWLCAPSDFEILRTLVLRTLSCIVRAAAAEIDKLFGDEWILSVWHQKNGSVNTFKFQPCVGGRRNLEGLVARLQLLNTAFSTAAAAGVSLLENFSRAIQILTGKRNRQEKKIFDLRAYNFSFLQIFSDIM